MVADPYKALGLTHDASPKQIKLAYRKHALRLHPDRLTRRNAADKERNAATTEFAKVAAAYALLMDPQRKREYDHIYKYGGYDDVEEDEIDTILGQGGNIHGTNSASRGTKRQQQQGHAASFASSPTRSCDPTQKKPARGIGYRCTDHVAYLFSQGRSASTTVAGIQIPSRLHMARPPSNGFRLSFSSGQFTTTPAGAKRYTSKTTQFVAGKKFTWVETTVVHPDGRKEILIEGDDYVERRTTPPTRTIPNGGVTQPHGGEGDLPWYMEAWHGIKDKLTACYSPCIPVQ